MGGIDLDNDNIHIQKYSKGMTISHANVKLFCSSFNGDVDGVLAALSQGARVGWVRRNRQGGSPEYQHPLFKAACLGHADICGLLLAYGSNVNETSPDAKKVTVLHSADKNLWWMFFSPGAQKLIHEIVWGTHLYMLPAQRVTCLVFR